MSQHRLAHRVAFGDCDPAGIVFYPRFFAWFDRCFHDWLRAFGGHHALCKELGAVGIGLTEVGASFRSPARDGDMLDIELTLSDFSARRLTLSYAIRCEERSVVTGHEERALFVHDGERIIAGDMHGLREILDGG